MNDENYQAVLFKLPKALLAHLDIYAAENFRSNRSSVIRRGISLLLQQNETEEMREGIENPIAYNFPYRILTSPDPPNHSGSGLI